MSTVEGGTAVTCPIMRMHPLNVAHAAATAAAMLPGRFYLGVGTGERLNEHVLGDAWPAASIRQGMLEDAIEVMRARWRAELRRRLVVPLEHELGIEGARHTRVGERVPHYP
jgi:alkanesulfonate monooxygenase SsuD/methylene tetrahydromethanopterin reductase-like flavin-dependent oxidoreductase (luciferase family)